MRQARLYVQVFAVAGLLALGGCGDEKPKEGDRGGSSVANATKTKDANAGKAGGAESRPSGEARGIPTSALATNVAGSPGPMPGTRKAHFFGVSADKADNVIYLLDNSGGAAVVIDYLRQELKGSVFRLTQGQNFHIIFFSRCLVCREIPSRSLVPATEGNKRQSAKFLDDEVAGGYGSSPVPAMIAAMEAFKNATDKGERVMYILTFLVDGGFNCSGYEYKTASGTKLTGSEAVIAWLRENNRDKFVRVYPIVVSTGAAPTPQVKQVMETIAKENGGEVRFVEIKQGLD